MHKKLLKYIIIAISSILIYFLFTNTFIFPCKLEGMSMFPTLAPDEIKLSNRWKVITDYKLNRGDIIIFNEPSVLYVSKEEFDANNVLAKYNNYFSINPFKNKFIKRIVGIPGDHIQITEKNELYLNEEKIGYANRSGYEEYMYVDLIIPEDSVYVMGDNRGESIDSRSFGCIPNNQIYSVLF